MTHTYSAGASRMSVVFTAIVGVHMGVILLVASDLIPPPYGTPVKPEPVDIRLLPPTPEPLKPVAPRWPDPLVPADNPVPEPVWPTPHFPDRPDVDSSDASAHPADRAGPALAEPAPDSVPPRLRMRDERLAALINGCYPAIARRAGEEGRAAARILVGRQGSVLSWRLERSTGFPNLDAAVRCIIERLVIEPGRRDGQAIEAEALLPIVFRLDR